MNNIEKIRAALRRENTEAILILSFSNRRYATGFPSSAGAALITQKDAYFFVDSRYIEAAEKSISGAHVEMTTAAEPYSVKINRVLTEKGIKTLGIEQNAMSYAEYLEYSEKLTAKLVPSQGILDSLRAVKEPEEVELLIAAQRIAEKALEQVLPMIKPGVTERDIAAELTYRMRRLGADNNSFDPIVITGEKTSMPHGVPGDVRVAAGDFVTMDFGCIYGGYCSDMTRTVAVGSASDEMKKVYNTVLRAQLAGIEAARAGISGRELDGAARSVITQAGYGEYFGHSFGHSLGLDIHESPNASPTNNDPLPAGAVVSAEPGIYLPGRFGVRIEDVIVLRDGGCEDITNAPKELMIL